MDISKDFDYICKRWLKGDQTPFWKAMNKEFLGLLPPIEED